MTAKHKKTGQSNDAAPTLLGLPRALDRLKLDLGPAPKFEIPLKKEHDGGRGLKEDKSPSLKEILPDYNLDAFLNFVLNAKKEVRERAADAVIRSEPDLLAAFQQSIAVHVLSSLKQGALPTVAPALWDNRTTGREVSPSDFILQHYAPWLGRGLTRAHIGRLDEKLYAAYARQIGRSPDKTISELPSEPKVRRDDPVEALERIRAQTRASKQRHSLSRKPT